MLQTLAPWLHNPRVTDLCINGALLYADQGDGLCRVTDFTLNPEATRSWLLEVLSRCGKSWDARMPFVDAQWEIPGVRFRIHAVFPPISESGVLISIRRLAGQSGERSQCSRWGWGLDRLREATRKGESILISGATGGGKTTLANDLLGFVPEHERILALEDTPELAPRHPHFISLQSRPPNSDGFGEITLRTLLRQTLRMRPDRIILGECRGVEVLDLLQTLNTGHRGSMATIHANSPRDALKRLEILALLSSPEALSVPLLREWIASGLQWIAQVGRGPDGTRQILEIARICGIECGTILLHTDSAPASGLSTGSGA